MRLSFRRLSPLAALAFVTSMFVISCLSDPAGPSYQPGYLALAPSFESSAAGIVNVASIHVVVIRDQDGSVVVDSVVTHEYFSDDVDLSFTIMVSSSSETFTLTLECLSPTDEVVFRAGPLTVTATTSDADGVVPQAVTITYVGVGFDAEDINVPGDDVFYIDMSDTLTLEAQALDSSGAAIPGTPIKWTSADTTMVKFPDPTVGRMQAGQIRGWVDVTAGLLTGPTDIVEVYVEPVPSEISIFSGDDQTGLVGTELPVILEVQVNAPDGPVEGSPVDFTTADGGSFAPASMTTNAEGYAWTTWTLGENSGTQTATATVRNRPALQATLTATAVFPVMQSLRFTTEPSNADAGAVIAPAVVVTAYNLLGAIDTEFNGTVAVGIATNPGDGTLSGTTTVAAAAGVAAFNDLTIDAAGAGYTIEATATGYLAATSSPFNIGSAQARQVAWTNASGGNWSEGANWSTGTPPTAIDTAVIVVPGEYMVTLDTDATVDALVLGSGVNQQALRIGGTTFTVNTSVIVNELAILWVDGNVAGDGLVTINGSLSWTSGTIGGAGLVMVNAGGLVALSDVATKTLDQRQLYSSGMVEWVRGAIVLANNAVIGNETTGQFLASPGASISGSGVFVNTGLFVQDGPDSTLVQVPFFNDGAIDVRAGYLVVESTFSHEAGALLQGVGTFDITGATITTFEGDIVPGQSPGILTVEGDLTLGASSTVYVEINGLTAGTDYDRLNVVGNLGVAGTLDITMGFTPDLGNSFGVIDFLTKSGNFATITGLPIGGGLELDTIWETNSLVLDVVAAAQGAGATIVWTGSGDGTSWGDAGNWDLGRVPASLDTVLITLDAAYTVNLAQDATVARLTLSDAANTATQVLEVTQGAVLRVDSAAAVATHGRLTLSGGTYQGADLSVAGAAVLDAGTMAGPGTTLVATGATFTIGSGSGTTLLDGRTIANDGTLEWSGNSISMDNGASIVNYATMNLTAENFLSWDQTGTEPQIVNNGTLRRTLTETATFIGVPVTFNSTSSLRVLAGILAFSANTSFLDATIEVGDGGTTASLAFSGGTHTIDGQSMVTMGPDGMLQVVAGTLTMAGSYDYTGGATSVTQVGGGTATFNNTTTAVIPNLVLGGGTLGGTGSILVADVFSWTGGRLEGSGALEINSGSTVSMGGPGLEFSERVMNNEGAIYIINGDGPTFSNGAILNNLATGTIDFIGGYSMLGTGTINNAGILVKSAAPATSTRIVPDVVNTGTIDVLAGTIALEGSFTHADGAIIQGNGTIDLTAVTDVPAFEGDVNPGTSPGVLGFIGNAIPGALSTANIEIGGLAAGTDYDRVTVTGSFTGNGTLNVSLINGFTPAVGNTFTVLTFASSTGDFFAYNGLDLGGGLVLEPQWNATSLDLVVTQPAPAQILFAGDSGIGGSTGVFTVNPDGTGLTRPYTTSSLGDMYTYPRWSPDRERIAFTSRVVGGPGENALLMMHATGDTLVTIVDDTSTYAPRWSPNGNHIAFECGDGWLTTDVCVVTGVSSALSSLSGIGNGSGKFYVTDFDVVNWNDGPWSFAWDPLDNDRLAVVRDSIPPTGGQDQSMIYTMLYNGTSLRRLVATGVLDVGNGPLQINGALDWSSDGQWLVFSAADPAGGQNIYRIDRNGANLAQLTTTADQDGDPRFSPDGSEILFGRDLSPGCDYDAWIMNADGSNAHAISAEHVCDWNLETLGADWSPDGQQIAITGFEEPYSNLFIYVIPRTTTAATYFTDRAVIGPLRGSGAAPYEVTDIQPNWRP